MLLNFGRNQEKKNKGGRPRQILRFYLVMFTMVVGH